MSELTKLLRKVRSEPYPAGIIRDGVRTQYLDDGGIVQITHRKFRDGSYSIGQYVYHVYDRTGKKIRKGKV